MTSIVVSTFHKELVSGRPVDEGTRLRPPIGNFAELRDLCRALLLADLASRTWLADAFTAVDPVSDNPFKQLAPITRPEQGGMDLQPMGSRIRRFASDKEMHTIGGLAFDLGAATNEIEVDAGHGPNSGPFESVGRNSARCLLDAAERVNDLNYFYREADDALVKLIPPPDGDTDLNGPG